MADDDNQDSPSWGKVADAAAKDAGRSILKYVFIGAFVIIVAMVAWWMLKSWVRSFVPDMPEISMPEMPEISMPKMPDMSLPDISLPSWGGDDADAAVTEPEAVPCGGYNIGKFCLTDGQ